MSRAALADLGEAERDALALALHGASPAELLGRAAEALARSGTYPPGYELAWIADNADVLGAWLTTQAGGPVGVESTRTGRWRLDAQDAAGFLDSLAAGSVDALVTDPPAGIGFLGHAWDGPRGGMGPWVVCDAERAYVRFARARLAQVEQQGPRVRSRKDGRR